MYFLFCFLLKLKLEIVILAPKRWSLTWCLLRKTWKCQPSQHWSLVKPLLPKENNLAIKKSLRAILHIGSLDPWRQGSISDLLFRKCRSNGEDKRKREKVSYKMKGKNSKEIKREWSPAINELRGCNLLSILLHNIST